MAKRKFSSIHKKEIKTKPRFEVIPAGRSFVVFGTSEQISVDDFMGKMKILIFLFLAILLIVRFTLKLYF